MSYKEAQKKYAKIGIDTEKAIKDLGKIAISLHCWQGDDVIGFDNGGGLTGGRISPPAGRTDRVRNISLCGP